jgi:hypothetical protein
MTDHRNSGEYHKADPGWRRRMQGVLVALVVAGIALLAFLQWWQARLAGSGSEGAVRGLHWGLGILCIALGLVAAVFATWLFRIAAATRAERRWPPSHMRTSSDVRIRYLTSADSLVVQMRAGAIALVLAALALAGYGAWLLRIAASP